MNMNSVFTSVPLTELLRALLDVSWKGMIILIFGSMLSAVFRRKSAAARHLVWSLAIAGLLTLPVLTLLLPVWQASILPQASWLSPVEAAMPSVAGETVPPGSSVSRQEAGTRASNPFAVFVLLTWLAGFFFTLARLILGTANVWQLRRQAKPISDDSWIMLARELALLLRSAPVTLLTSQHIRMPMTCGVFRAGVMLPAEADGWSAECRRFVLLHEFAHIKRQDVLTQFLARIACAMYWFNPLVWWASNRLRAERELACDSQVLRLGTRATDYAHFLIEIAATLNPARYGSPESVGMASSHLEGRVRAILNPHVTRADTRSLPVVISGIAIAALLLPLAAIRVGTKPPLKQNQRLDHLVAGQLPGAPASSIASSDLRATTTRRDKTFEPKRRPPDENHFLEISESESETAAQTPAQKVDDFPPQTDGRQGTGRGVGIGTGKGFLVEPVAYTIPKLPSISTTISTRTSTSASAGPTVTNVVSNVVSNVVTSAPRTH